MEWKLSWDDNRIPVPSIHVRNLCGLLGGGLGLFAEAAGAVVVGAVDAADHGDAAGADELDDAEGAHQVDEGFDLLLLAGDFDHDFFRGDVDDLAAEDFAELADLAALALGGAGP